MSLHGQKLLSLSCSQSQIKYPPLTSNPILSREGDSLFLPRARTGSGSETCRWAHGYLHPSRPVSRSLCTEGQNVGYPCLPCCPLPGLLNLTSLWEYLAQGDYQHQSPSHPSFSSSPFQKEGKGILDNAVLQLHFDKEYCVDSCNVGKRFVMYLRVLVDNFKADPNN